MYGYYPEVVDDYRLYKSLYKRLSPRLGDVLLHAADKGVKVRLLIWNVGDLFYNLPRLLNTHVDPALTEKQRSLSNQFMENVYVPIAPSLQYRYLWYRKIAAHPNIALRTVGPALNEAAARGLTKVLVDRLNSGSFDLKAEGYLAGLARANIPAHHSKTVMVDYVNPASAHAYVMGNNLRTADFDTPLHPAEPPERGGRYPGDSPRRDIAAWVRGPALHDINAAFSRVWSEWGGGNLGRSGIQPDAFILPGSALGNKRQIMSDAFGNAQVSCTALGSGKPSCIHDAYERAICSCTRYVYMENQYFRYLPVAQRLTSYAADRKARGSHKYGEPIYYFIVVGAINWYAGHTTYETVKELGHEGQLSGELRKEYDELVKQRGDLRRQEMERRKREAVPGRHGPLIPSETEAQLQEIGVRIDDLVQKHPSLVNPGPLTPDDTPDSEDAFRVQDVEGLKGHLATLTACRPDEHFLIFNNYVYNQVDVHSKMMIVDDVFVTIGSANLNIRSMQHDNEVNISATRPGMAKKLREDIFHQLMGYSPKGTWRDIYDEWKFTLKRNWRHQYKKESLEGLLTYLYRPEPFGSVTLD
jgi:phosphatidylserine/phosphatidylglycerophosphate/cardiolipin synthase-like enzyme